MTHIVLLLAALLSAGVGVFILVATHASTASGVIAGSFFVLLTIALVVPVQLAAAKDSIRELVASIKDAARGEPPAGGST